MGAATASGTRTAQRLFATEGLGVSLDEIARRAGVGPGTVHRHFPAQTIAEADALAATDDPAALFTLLSRMIASGAENVAAKSALVAAEFDLRTAAPQVAVDLSGRVEALLRRAREATTDRLGPSGQTG